MLQPTDETRETASQTAGPYVHIGCVPSFAGLSSIYPEELGKSPITDTAKGAVITITGFIFDGAGAPVRDAMMESWQADAMGVYAGQPGVDPGVTGFCRVASDGDTGAFSLRTIKPGSADGQAPHIALWIVARGINTGLSTRLYFPEDDHSTDPVLTRIEQQDRVKTLIADKTGDTTYHFDIHLQGDRETVFLDM